MKKYGWLIYNKKDATENSPYIKWFIKEALQQNLLLELVLRENITIGILNNERTVLLHKSNINLPKFAVVRTVEPLLNLHLESCGIKVFNSAAISSICNNKSLTHHEVNKLNIPMVNTLFLKKENAEIAPPMDFPFVVKESSGRSGKQVYFIQTNGDWKECLTMLSTSEFVVQACPVKLGKDVRIFIVGKEIIGAVMRENSTDFRSNFKLGGSASWYPLQKDERHLINKIVQHFDFDMVGIDFLIGLNGELLFNEIEDVVGSRTLSVTSDINILEKYVTHIKQTL